MELLQATLLCLKTLALGTAIDVLASSRPPAHLHGSPAMFKPTRLVPAPSTTDLHFGTDVASLPLAVDAKSDKGWRLQTMIFPTSSACLLRKLVLRPRGVSMTAAFLASC